MKALKSFLINEYSEGDFVNFESYIRTIFKEFNYDEIKKIKESFKTTKSLYKTLEKIENGWGEIMNALNIVCDHFDDYCPEEEDTKKYLKIHDMDISRWLLIDMGIIKLDFEKNK